MQIIISIFDWFQTRVIQTDLCLVEAGASQSFLLFLQITFPGSSLYCLWRRGKYRLWLPNCVKTALFLGYSDAEIEISLGILTLKLVLAEDFENISFGIKQQCNLWFCLTGLAKCQMELKWQSREQKPGFRRTHSLLEILGSRTSLYSGNISCYVLYYITCKEADYIFKSSACWDPLEAKILKH